MLNKSKLLALFLVFFMIISLGVGCGTNEEASVEEEEQPAEEEKPVEEELNFKTAVMIPGTIAENPVFQMLIEGISMASQELGIDEPKVIEGGSDWDFYSKSMVALSESGEYDLIITATSGMAYSVVENALEYPDQKYLLFGGELEGMADTIPANAWSVRYKTEDTGYLGGYFCALVTQSQMENANEDLAIGLLFTDVYKDWEEHIKPAFYNGAYHVNPDVEVVNMVVGSWVDVMMGMEKARAMFAQGVDIVWYSTGASTLGCVDEAAAQGKYAVASDHNAISENPDVIVGSTTINATAYTYEIFKQAALGTLEYGQTVDAGAAEGVVSFTFDDPIYIETVPEDIRIAMEEVYTKLAAGEIDPLAVTEASADLVSQ